MPTVIVGYPDQRSFEADLPVVDGRPMSAVAVAASGRYGHWIGMGEHTEEGLRVARHEYFHTIANQNFRRLPFALNEGLADYYSTLSITPEGALVGRPPAGYIELLRRRQLMPMDELLALDEAGYRSLRGAAQSTFYVQSWVLVHYLLSGDSTGSRFSALLDEVASGGEVRTVFEKCFPREDWTTLPMQLDLYANSSTFSMRYLDVSADSLVVEAALEEVPASQVRTHRAVWRNALGSDSTVTRQMLLEVLQVEPTSQLARAVLGLQAQGRGDFATARRWYGSVSSRGDTDALATAIAGFGSMVMMSDGRAYDFEQLKLGRALLEASVTADSTNACALGWYGVARVLSDEVDDRTADALIEASRAVPDEPIYASMLSAALASAGHVEAARKVAERSRSMRHNEDLRDQALERVGFIAMADSVREAQLRGDHDAARDILRRATASATDPERRGQLESFLAAADSAALQDSAVTYFNQGAEAMRDGRGDRARPLFARARQLTPFPDFREQAATAEASADSLERQMKAADEFDAGGNAARVGDYKTARRCFERARDLSVMPEAREGARKAALLAWAMDEYEWGLALLRKSEWSSALRAFEHARSLSPDREFAARAAKRAEETRTIMTNVGAARR